MNLLLKLNLENSEQIFKTFTGMKKEFCERERNSLKETETDSTISVIQRN